MSELDVFSGVPQGSRVGSLFIFPTSPHKQLTIPNHVKMNGLRGRLQIHWSQPMTQHQCRTQKVKHNIKILALV